MLWDTISLTYLLNYMKLHLGDITERDSTHHNNDFEVFINPNNNVFNYGEIEINAFGTEWDLFLNKSHTD